MGTSLVPSGEIGTFLDKTPMPNVQFGCPLRILLRNCFWDIDPIRSAQVRLTAPRLHSTTWDLVQIAGAKTHPTAAFLFGHLHDRDIEGVRNVGGSGQMPTAVETLWVVVGPAHQHWLLRRGCRERERTITCGGGVIAGF